jgi:hypothetical protein
MQRGGTSVEMRDGNHESHTTYSALPGQFDAGGAGIVRSRPQAGSGGARWKDYRRYPGPGTFCADIPADFKDTLIPIILLFLATNDLMLRASPPYQPVIVKRFFSDSFRS